METDSNTATKNDLQLAWAFAVNPYRPRHRKVGSGAYRAAKITSCSKQARQLGIREGMYYQEAKQLVPEIKILVIGERNR